LSRERNVEARNLCQELEIELFSNTYNLLMLLWVPRRVFRALPPMTQR
jgi:hypothetical protein